MRTIGKTLAALTLATAATFGGFAAPAAAGGGGGGGLISIGNVDVVLVDASGNQVVLLQNVSVTDAANFCQINIDVLTAELLSGDKAACSSRNQGNQKAWVKKH